MKLLLHTCCAPCAIYPVEEAKKDGFVITGLFYNPNIHPNSEYIRRKKDAEIYFGSEGLSLISEEHDASSFFKNVRREEASPGRCSICWDMRLKETTRVAKEKSFDAFTTTLLGSPYQDHHLLKGICENLSKEKNLNFYYKDFRIGHREAHDLAKEKGIYCQNYCGCVFSMVEREERRREKRKFMNRFQALYEPFSGVNLRVKTVHKNGS